MRIVKTILKKKNQEGRISLPNVKVYHTANTVTKTGTGGGTDIQISGKGENSDPHKYSQLIFIMDNRAPSSSFPSVRVALVSDF